MKPNMYLKLVIVCISLHFYNPSIAMEEESGEDIREFKFKTTKSARLCICSILRQIASEEPSIELKNGGKTDLWTLMSTDQSLRKVHHTHPTAVQELIQKYNNPNATFGGNSFLILQRYQLIDENHNPHQHKKDIIFSMISHEGDKLTLVSPVPLIQVSSE